MSQFRKLREALQYNPIRTGEIVDLSNDDIGFVMSKVEQGGWVTVESYEASVVSKMRGYCNLILINVSPQIRNTLNPTCLGRLSAKVQAFNDA